VQEIWGPKTKNSRNTTQHEGVGQTGPLVGVCASQDLGQGTLGGKTSSKGTMCNQDSIVMVNTGKRYKRIFLSGVISTIGTKQKTPKSLPGWGKKRLKG